MFDGNHRSKRQVNLGGQRRRQSAAKRAAGSRKKTTPSSSSFLQTGATGIEDQKAQTLEAARVLRQERQVLQKHQAAAKCIERYWRGHISRKQLVQALSSCQQMSITQLSMLLSPPLKRIITDNKQTVLCQVLCQNEHVVINNTKSISIPAQRRILSTCLECLQPAADSLQQNTMKDNNNNNKRLLAMIQTLLSSCNDKQQLVINLDLFLQFISACQVFGVCQPNENAVMRNSSDMETCQCLWNWSCQLATILQTTEAFALLEVTRLLLSSNAAACVDNHDLAMRSNHWLSSLVQVLKQNENDDSMETETTTTNTSISTTIKSMMQGKHVVILANALELYKNTNPQDLIMLVNYTFQQHPDLATLAALVVQGQDIKAVILEKKPLDSSSMHLGMDDDDISSSDDEDDEEMDGAATTFQSKRQEATSSRHLRKNVQTVPKFNRLYQTSCATRIRNLVEQVQRLDFAEQQAIVKLAQDIATPALWQTWGRLVLSSNGSSAAARNAYIQLLASLLQFCSGLKPSATSPFLSQLVLERSLLENLWRNLLVLLVNGNDSTTDENDVMSTILSTTVFCDLFAHHLIALRDSDFLQYYTTAAAGNNKNNANPIIMAEHVIERIKTLLHDLYWTKPVVVSDFMSLATGSFSSERFRLMLSATKLWNSLYERWCRLVRQAPFCDETAWWFPRLVSRDDHGAVVSSHENRGNDDMMDIDDNNDDALADAFRDPKMARILTCIPQALPFDRRVKLFDALLKADKLKTQDESADIHRIIERMMEEGRDEQELGMVGRERVEIHRDNLYQDSMEQLSQLGSRLKRKVQVTFINKHGNAEPGIDGGGIIKEFLDDLIREAFDPSLSQDSSIPHLFSVTPLETLAVNMNTTSQEHLKHYEFLGRVLGKAVYESILVEPQFCLPFLNQLLGKQNSLEDLKNFDPEFYTNILKLRDMSADEIAGLGLTFELTLGPHRTVPLIPGGHAVPVTKQNAIHYAHLVAHRRLNIEGALSTRAFLRGFRDLIPASWVRLFSAHELQKLISGDDSVRGIDVPSLQQAMQYAAGYHPSQPIVKWFWQVLDDLGPELQQKFLKFMTSCSRQPLLGFGSLEPAPCIQQIRLPDDMFEEIGRAAKDAPLPTSATCMNLLKLPNYRSKELLREKLLTAIESGAGFELT